MLDAVATGNLRPAQATTLILCLLWPALALAVGAPGPDAFGYSVASTTNFSFLQITNGSARVLWFDDDAAVTNVSLGLNFSFYGVSYSNVSFSVNGLMTFGGASIAYTNVNLTTTSPANNLPSIAVLWDDWETLSSGADGVYYKTTGTAGGRQFIVQWNKAIPVNGDGTNAVTFQARLFEGSNRILFSYSDVAVANETTPVAGNGVGATVGIRDISGQTNNRNLQWSFNQAVITNGLNVLFTVANHAPVINSAVITPFSPTTTNSLLASVTSASDLDGDLISYAYQWQQSTNTVAFTDLTGQTANTLGAASTIAANYCRVVITPNDGQTNGSSFATASVLVIVDSNNNGINDDWEVANFGYIGVDPNADPDGDGFNNLQEFTAGTDATNATSAFRISSIAREGDHLRVTWTMGSGKTNSLERSIGDVGGGFSNNFAAIFTVTNTVGTITNFLDSGAATNVPARYYRVRLLP